MAFGDPYATFEQLEARLGREADASFERLLDAASRAVESFTRRQFNRADDDDYDVSVRRFRALDRMRVAVDDFYTTDDLVVEVNGVFWDTDAHIDPRPWNGPLSVQFNWPYSDLFAVGRSFPWSRRALVKVAARWGWESVPAGIVEATLDVAEVMSLSLTSGQAGAKRGEVIGGYSVFYSAPLNHTATADVPPELVKAIPYRRKQFGVA
jgi:hypothetical protein